VRNFLWEWGGGRFYFYFILVLFILGAFSTRACWILDGYSVLGATRVRWLAATSYLTRSLKKALTLPLDKTLYSHFASLHPRVKMGNGELLGQSAINYHFIQGE